MKILISADMEGITGVTTREHVRPGGEEYARFRRVMTQDVNAAVRGALEAGAAEVLIADGHAAGSNILVEELDPRARLNSGSPSPLSMMQGMGDDVDGVFFVGYHARQGSVNAVLDHTWSSACVANLWLNDRISGEYTLNAAVAGYYHAPILMISGDQTACAQAVEQLGPLETAVVKQASGRFAAQCLAPSTAQALIQGAAKRAVERLGQHDSPRPFVLSPPVKVTVELFRSEMADQAALLPGAVRDGLKLSVVSADMLQAYAAFRALVQLADPS
jgi:D-amino peptidase